ncbi:MAG: acyl-[acyl-carrier-protein] thioesterase [Lachnospiraceae bacterium]|jgi:acyl-ACP thioesterase|nr:acyl-[acyl-carrier-protein] thioesterase [Lachnospiraceae bacterium]
MYTFEGRIRYSECTSDECLSFSSLLDYFQDCSTFQSEDLGVGIRFLKERNLIWVLASWQIEVIRMPHLLEEVVIGTFPYEFKGFLGTRNFCMMTKNKEYLAKANSIWSLVDLKTQKPIAAPSYLLEKYVLEPKLSMTYLPRKIILPPNETLEEPIVIKKHHLDSNNHVNNGQYINMALEYLPDGYQFGTMRAEYRKQAWLQDVLYPCHAQEENRFIVSLRNEEGIAFCNVEFRREVNLTQMDATI